MSLQFETVAIPIVKGIDLNTSARLVEAPTLLAAENVTFNKDGASKRAGHVATKLRSGPFLQTSFDIPALDKPALTPYGLKVLDSSWLLGWGYITSDTRVDATADARRTGLSPHPDAGYLFGGLKRDDEIVSWTGHSLITLGTGENFVSDSTQSPGRIEPAMLPVLRATPIAKSNNQYFADAAENGRVQVIVWSTGSSFSSTGHALYFSVYDKARGSLIWSKQKITATKPWYPRIISMGSWFHIFWIELDTNTLKHTYFNDIELADSIQTDSVGECHGYYDVWKESETKTVVLFNDSANLFTAWFKFNGQSPNDEVDAQLLTQYLVDSVLTDIVPVECTICTHPTTGNMGISVASQVGGAGSGNLLGFVFTRQGVLLGSQDLGTAVGPGGVDNGHSRLTIAPKYLLSSTNKNLFDIYFGQTVVGIGCNVTRFRFNEAGTYTDSGAPHVVYNLNVASRGFAVGDRTFVWASYNSTLQSTWILLDETLRPTGKLNFNTAYTPSISNSDLPTVKSVNFFQGGEFKDQAVYHLALQYNLRVATTSDQVGLYTEPSIQFVAMDFLPRLRAVQAGRCTYVAGAQVWCYDGERLTEAGFHLAPEAISSQSNGGALTTVGTYIYRIDLCHKNAQNEEVRSHSLIMAPVVLTGTNKTITLSIKTMPTRREDAYILVFRNAMIAGAPTSTWNLINSRNPADTTFLLNDQTLGAVTFVDAGAVTDTAGLNRELHPGNNLQFLQPFAPPACEIIAAGRDRVWLAGGEITPGQVYPSRLYDVGEVPSWNGNLAVQIDRNEDPITGIGFVGDIAAVFHQNSIYVLEGDGPDNSSQGNFAPARIAVSDCGLLTQESLALCNAGLVFQSAAGFRLLNQGGQISPLGQMVDPLARDTEVTGVICAPGENEIRWYSESGAIVYNYLVGAWSTWTSGGTMPLVTPEGVVFLIRGDGYVWEQTPDHYRDGPGTYTMTVRLPWLHAAQLQDFQRIRRLGGFGTYTEPHKIRLRLYYDEEVAPRETFTWDFPDPTQNTDTWGSLTWGAGFWGDDAGSPRARDSVWRWRRKPRRQKCSVFSLSLDDHGTDGSGFALVGIGLELAKKSGLDRIAPAANNSTFRP